ncbi:hypothetical protein [Aquabacterium sp.]|uniref:hypothetical protein n=1 Tax=Aquabacterium sp. TaxID=1872578 RepID=UPI00248A2F63|nr:hypothetical protein [Aquabacterium sp.]MDI1260959.1 hypothetical protein [Aquabacterium sp.]
MWGSVHHSLSASDSQAPLVGAGVATVLPGWLVVAGEEASLSERTLTWALLPAAPT